MTSSLGSYRAIFQSQENHTPRGVQVRDKSHVNQRIAWKLDSHGVLSDPHDFSLPERSKEFADGGPVQHGFHVLRNSEDRDRYTRVPVGRIHLQYLAVQWVSTTDLRFDASEIYVLTNE